jgi:hypothetical protein
MQNQINRVFRWISAHRYQITLVAYLVFTLGLLIVATPVLLVIALVESHQTARDKRHRDQPAGLTAFITLLMAVRWLWQELHGLPHGPWRPCAQCGRPIEEPSRAAYCSHACRSWARLEREALDNDPRIAERAARRLRNRRLRDLADNDPDLNEVPF